MNSQEDRNLDELIRIAISEMPDDCQWPDEEDILAYVHGNATEEQQSTIQGIIAKSTHPKVLSEEAPDAYKDIDEVIRSVDGAGISRPVARMRPLGVVKG